MLRRGPMIAAFVALASIAIAGWVRKPAPAFAQMPYSQTTSGFWDNQAIPAGRYVNPCAPAVMPAYYQSQAVAYRPVAYQPVRRYTPTRVVRKRPLKHSVAIVAGSSGAGAAIGALAGGGRGAAIGALSGGVAGFIYDRLAHKKVE